ncbi:hypothetical protein LLG95_12810 [bacterium]|nr:hypothetical protein [bacterium]
MLKSILHADIGLIVKNCVKKYFQREPLLATGLLSTVVLGILIDQQAPYINGIREWHWPYAMRLFWAGLLIGAAHLAPWAAAMAVIGFGISRLKGRLRTALGLAALVAWGMLVCWTSLFAISPSGITHIARAVQSPVATGYFNIAAELSDRTPHSLLEFYPARMKYMPLHPSTHPPGGVAVCKAVLDICVASPALAKAINAAASLFGYNPAELVTPVSSSRAASLIAIGNLMLLFGMLTAVPLFMLVRDGMGGGLVGRRAAWAAALIWVHYPALIVFTPEFDEVYPFMAFAAAWCLWRGMNSSGNRIALWGAAAGAIFVAGVLLSFTILVWAPLFMLMIFLECVRRANSWDPAAYRHQIARAFRLVAGAVIAGGLILLALRFILGLDLVPIYREAFEMNRQFRIRAGRSYFAWLLFSPWDMLLVAGPALAILALVFTFRSLPRGRRSPNRLMSAWFIAPFGVAFMTLTGLMPGENARLYLMFAPAIAWAGAAWLALHSRRRFYINLALILAAQFVFIYFLRAKMNFMDM